MSRIDLHIHTSDSDGKYTPPEIVAKAAKAGVKLMAICDHDTVNGIESAMQAANKVPGLTLVPGV